MMYNIDLLSDAFQESGVEEMSTAKELIANAITNKGVSTSSTDSFITMASNIGLIDPNISVQNYQRTGVQNFYGGSLSVTFTQSAKYAVVCLSYYINERGSNLSALGYSGDGSNILYRNTSGSFHNAQHQVGIFKDVKANEKVTMSYNTGGDNWVYWVSDIIYLTT